MQAVEQEVDEAGLYAAGFISYEAATGFDAALITRAPGCFPLLWFGIFKEPESINLPVKPAADADITWQASISERDYQRTFRRIKRHIEAGDTYQVNYSFRLQAPFADDPWSLFLRMIHAQGSGYGAFVDIGTHSLCSASPELLFSLNAETLISRPMKGTVERGLWSAEDQSHRDWLAQSEKNRAENVMIVDMVRNDMGRIADTGSVQVTHLFDVEKYPTLWQLTSSVRCTTRRSVTDILGALFPAASITGAPKAHTMQLIAELETSPRNIYTGTIGYLAPNRRAQFNVAIRTVLVDKADHSAEYGVGGGIVWDSQERSEWQECYAKAKVLGQLATDFDVLETIRWTPDEGYFLLDRHMDRLAASADYFSRLIDAATLRAKLAKLADTLPLQPHRVRLLLPKANEPIVQAYPLKPSAPIYRARLAKQSIDSKNPFLYHKTTQREVYEQALAEWPGYDDVVLWNENQQITESCIANIIVELDGKRLTPPVRCGLLAGVYRSWLLEQGQIVESIITVDDLSRCSGVYLINSVRGLWEVVLD
ncbi:MAG: aminodeoxychorismate synthase component I [Candidatus Competibacteraceae bacterium]|nr:aminodeoxychorismate synthase component I [Candidatus Competibacteraceae bacterium]